MTGKCFIRLTPGGQEDLLLHVSVLDEEDVNGNDAGKVEHVDVVLDSNLKKKSSPSSIWIRTLYYKAYNTFLARQLPL